MTLSMLAKVALGDLGKMPAPSRVLAPPACETMTVSFSNPMATGDQIVVRTQMNVQSVSLVGDVAPRQPVVLQLSPGGKVESVFHAHAQGLSRVLRDGSAEAPRRQVHAEAEAG